MGACRTCRHHQVDVDVGITRRDRLCGERNVSIAVIGHFLAGPDDDTGCPWWDARPTREQLTQLAREDAQRWADAEARARTGRADARGEPEPAGSDRRVGPDRRRSDRRSVDRRSAAA